MSVSAPLVREERVGAIFERVQPLRGGEKDDGLYGASNNFANIGGTFPVAFLMK